MKHKAVQMAIEKYQKIGNEESLLSILINLIDFWNKKDNFNKALFYANRSNCISQN